MLLMDTINFCSKTIAVWQVVGNILLVFKIVIPILLVIFGMLDLGKAVVGAKDDEIKKAAKQLLMRAIAGIAVFLVPTLVSFIFTLVGDFQEIESDYNICGACISHPNNEAECHKAQ